MRALLVLTVLTGCSPSRLLDLHAPEAHDDKGPWIFESTQSGALLGVTVASAGDVDGDGFNDVIVGAPGYDTSENSEDGDVGAAWLYAGSATGPTQAWVHYGTQGAARFGHVVASAGDVNGDGYADVLVASDGYDNVEVAEGLVELFLGSADGLGHTAAWSIEGNQNDVVLGLSVASAGDVNADGYADVIVGAPIWTQTLAAEGTARVYLGGPDGLAELPVWTVYGGQENAFLGDSVASAGDVDGDGYGDVVVGASHYDGDETDQGLVLVYLGSAEGLDTSPSASLMVDQASAEFHRARAAGDVDGDGYGDVIVGAAYYTDGEDGEGGAFLFRGGAAGLSTTPSWTATSGQAEANLGVAVDSAGDFNGDGYADVAVAADYFGPTGRVWVYLGSPTGLGAQPTHTLDGTQSGEYFGRALAAAGDVDGDGFGDLVVGAPQYVAVDDNDGRFLVFAGAAAKVASTAAWTVTGANDIAQMGSALAFAGDVNGDGYGDAILGASGTGAAYNGAAYVYFGGAGGLSTESGDHVTLGPGPAFSLFGGGVAGAGDVDGDGYADVAVGSPSYDKATNDDSGRVSVWYGSATGVVATPWTADSPIVNGGFGLAVDGAGDVDGDGYGDLIVGAPYTSHGEEYEGRIYLFLGGPSGLATSPSWTYESDTAYATLGTDVGTAGDVNGDGYADVIAAADATGAYVWLGGPLGLDAEPAWSVLSDQAGSRFANAAATAGDVDCDGYSDVIIGAFVYDDEEIDGGKVWVYSGGPDGLATTPSWSRTSSQADAGMGWAAASAGDVDGDGCGDILVGAHVHDGPGGADAGRAYLYLGSPQGLGSHVWISEGPPAKGAYGYEVAGGDLSGDGFADLLIGANPSTLPGYAYQFLGNGHSGAHLAPLPQALQPGSTVPIVAGLPSEQTGFDVLVAKARSPWGSGPIALQVEAKPLGEPFDGTGLAQTSDWLASGLTGIDLTGAVGDLEEATGYHWRARVVVRPSQGVPQGTGMWMYGGTSGEAEGSHVFTRGTLYSADSDGDDYGDMQIAGLFRGIRPGWVDDSTDCDDANASRHPGATDIPNDGIDQDCDGEDAVDTGDTGDTGDTDTGDTGDTDDTDTDDTADTGDTGSPDTGDTGSPDTDDTDTDSGGDTDTDSGGDDTADDTGGDDTGTPSGCGCTTTGGGTPWALVLCALPIVRRRRR